MFRYSECFSSVQGEGFYTGVPSTFFRTSYCNLRCGWDNNLCDTPYTSWQPEQKEISVEDAFEQIQAFGNKHVVITGGEPFLWNEELKSLCWRLHNHIVTIETNATIYYPVSADLISMSPKLSNSTPWKHDTKWAKKHERDRINLEVIQEFVDDYDHQFKFVISDGSELDEIVSLLDQLKNVQPDNIMLMPEGITAEEIRQKQEMVVGICQQMGWRYSDRLHVRLWGNQRGV